MPHWKVEVQYCANLPYDEARICESTVSQRTGWFLHVDNQQETFVSNYTLRVPYISIVTRFFGVESSVVSIAVLLSISVNKETASSAGMVSIWICSLGA
jgi:hypothetical protein